MLKDLLKEGGLYTFANIITRGISLLLIPLYTSEFIPEDYGVIDVLSVFGLILTNIITLQLNQSIGRYIADKSISKEEKINLVSTGFLVVFSILTLCGVIIYFYPNIVSNLLSNEELVIAPKIVILAILATLLGSLFHYIGAHLRFLRMVKQFSILSFLFAIINIGLTVYFVLIMRTGFQGIYYSAIITSPFFVVISIYLIRDYIKIKFQFDSLKKLLAYSSPLIPASLAYLAMNSLDRYYIKEMLDFEELGLYGVAFKFSTIITLVISGFTMATSPIIFGSYKDKKLKSELESSFNFFFLLGSLGLLGLSLFSEETLIIFTNESYYQAYTVMPILYASVLVTGLGMFSPGINIAKKTKISLLVVTICAIVNAILNYFLIGFFELNGAAIATLSSMALYYLVYFKVSKKYFPISLQLKRKAPLFLLMVSFIITGCYLIDFGLFWNIVIKVVFVLIYAIILYLYFIKPGLVKIKR